VSGPAEIRAGRRAVKITHPDRVMFPAAGLTKLDLARYYADVAPAMLPHVRDRPLAMHVFPGGIEAQGHYLKDAPRHFPDWVKRARMPKHGGSVNHVLINDAATLVYLAGQNMVTPHVSRAGAYRPDRPDRLIVDFDPPENRSFAEVRAAARAAGDLLSDLGLEPHAMVTGSRGIHVVCPIKRTASWEKARLFLNHVSRLLVADNRDSLTGARYKSQRRGKIFVDVGRTAYAQHAVAPYAVRPRPKAPVATPLRWEELSDGRLRPDRWTVKTVLKRLDDIGDDPWRDIGKTARAVPTIPEAAARPLDGDPPPWVRSARSPE
jgi:bifunctional non-homologous end joining protein LigD